MSTFRIFLLLLLVVDTLCLDKSTLKFVQILFRHGDRNPNNYLFLPSDPPELRIPWEPNEKSELTLKGVEQLFGVGQHLRKRYGYLVNYKYLPSEVYVHSGEDNRTVASALALLAGFFPPNQEQTWNPSLPWIPIALHTKKTIDDVTFGIFEHCPPMREIIEASADYKRKMDEDKDLLAFVSEHSGVQVDSLRKMDKVSDNLLLREIHNDTHPLPDWGNQVAHKRSFSIIKGSLQDVVYGIPEIGEPCGGWMLTEVLAQFGNFINQNTKHKLFFYSGHDSNIAAVSKLLQLNNVNTKEIPDFGSYMAFELHQQNGQYYVQLWVREQLKGDGDPFLAKITDCPDPCPLEKFSRLSPRVSDEQFRIACGSQEDKSQSFRLATIILAVICGVLLIALIGACSCYCSAKKKLDPERRPLVPDESNSLYIRQ